MLTHCYVSSLHAGDGQKMCVFHSIQNMEKKMPGTLKVWSFLVNKLLTYFLPSLYTVSDPAELHSEKCFLP